MQSGEPGFALPDVRSPARFAEGRIPSALNLPRGDMAERRLYDWPAGALSVVSCAGPHCVGVDRAALRLAELGRSARVMVGGAAGWAGEGLAFAT